jgi:cell division protein FtsW (lipid II flippase)
MYEYMKRHEAFIRATLAPGSGCEDWAALARYHDTQLHYMQHERIVHLLVTLFVGLFALLTLLFLAARPSITMSVLVLLLLALFVPYLVHYYRLENGVQRWYDLANEVERRCHPAVLPAHRAG